MGRFLRTRAALVAMSLLGLGAIAVTPFAATAAPTPTEVAVFPPDQNPRLPTDRIVVAGETGYLHVPLNSGAFVWTTYATLTNRVVTGLSGVTIREAGADRI